jgi:hypothetical protein
VLAAPSLTNAQNSCKATERHLELRVDDTAPVQVIAIELAFGKSAEREIL